MHDRKVDRLRVLKTRDYDVDQEAGIQKDKRKGW